MEVDVYVSTCWNPVEPRGLYQDRKSLTWAQKGYEQVLVMANFSYRLYLTTRYFDFGWGLVSKLFFGYKPNTSFNAILCLRQVQRMCSIFVCGIWRLSKGTQLTFRWLPITDQPYTTHALSHGSATAFPLSQTSLQTLTSKPDTCCYVRGLVQINVHIPKLTEEFCFWM